MRNRDFRLLMLAQFAAQTGYWSFYVAQGWLALQLTNSPGWVGLITTAGLIPFLFIALPAGVLADRVDLKRLMITSRTLVVFFHTCEAVLVATGLITPWQMLLMGLAAGTAMVVDNPAQSRLVGDFVRPDEIPSAASLNSANLQTSIILGPVLGGAMLATVGPAGGILMAAIGNAILLGAYAVMAIPRRPVHPPTEGAWTQFQQGVRFVASNGAVGASAAILALTILLVLPYQALMSVFVRDELHEGGFELGLLLTAPGLGALIGSTVAAYERLVPPRIPTMALGVAAAGASLAALGWATGMAGALPLLLALGAAWGIVYVMGTAIPLMHTPVALRGRVMSIFLMMWGMTPIGATAAGIVADTAGTRAVFALAGQGVIVLAAGILLIGVVVRLARPSRRPSRQPAAGSTANAPHPSAPHAAVTDNPRHAPGRARPARRSRLRW